MIRYFDSHAHLMGEEFDQDREKVIEACIEKHVERIMIITLNNEETKRALALKQLDPKMFQVACGIFPLDLDMVDDAYYKEFCKLASLPEVDCIGEIGLDYYWEKDVEKRLLQKEYFIKQIELAKSLDKPILVHSRDAIQDTYDILKEHHTKGLLHCFPGSKEMAKNFTDLGYYLALGGPVTFKNARHSKEVVESMDERFLLSETDSPYMAPEPVRGTRNDPSNIPYIVQKMADVKGMSLEKMASILDENYTRFLKGE